MGLSKGSPGLPASRAENCYRELRQINTPKQQKIVRNQNKQEITLMLMFMLRLRLRLRQKYQPCNL
jgi:hypothetical protein